VLVLAGRESGLGDRSKYLTKPEAAAWTEYYQRLVTLRQCTRRFMRPRTRRPPRKELDDAVAFCRLIATFAKRRFDAKQSARGGCTGGTDPDPIE
jgi:hypothetical protein